MALTIIMNRDTGQGFAGNAFSSQFMPTVEACVFSSLTSGRATYVAISNLKLIDQTAKELRERFVHFKTKIINHVGLYDMKTRLHTILAAETYGRMRAICTFTLLDYAQHQRVPMTLNVIRAFTFDETTFQVTNPVTDERTARLKYNLEEIIKNSHMTRVRASDVKEDLTELGEWFQSQLSEQERQRLLDWQSSLT